jgi:hypothetical protein
MVRRTLRTIPCDIENAEYYYKKGVKAGFYLANLYNKKRLESEVQKGRKLNVLNQLKSLKTETQYRNMGQRELQTIARQIGISNYSRAKTDLLVDLIPALRARKMIRLGNGRKRKT